MRQFQKKNFYCLLLLVTFAYAQEFELKQGLLHNILPFNDDYILSLAKQYNSQITINHEKFKRFKESVRRVRKHNLKTNGTYLHILCDSPFAFVSDGEFFSNYLGSQDCSATAFQTLQNPKNIQRINEIVPETLQIGRLLIK